MKIRHIPARKFGKIDSEALRISPYLQLLFGYVDADTTSIRNSIRYLYYGREKDFVVSETDKAELEFQFDSDSTIGSRFSDGVRLRDSVLRKEFERVLREIDYATYSSFFDMNFGAGDTTGTQLCFQLKQRFNVPYGDILKSGDPDLNQRSADKLKLRINQVNQEITQAHLEMDKLASGLDDLENRDLENRGPTAGEFERTQKKSLENRIEKLRDKLELMRVRACELEDEIEQANLEAVPAKEIAASSPLVHATQQLADQLGSIDAQVQRWKNVKNDIDGRLTELQGDLCSSRVADFDTAFDELRLSVGMVEEKLLKLLDKEDESSEKSDTLQNLVSIQHEICDSLSSIQEHWRDTIVNSEIDELGRCSHELNRYLERLRRERNRLESGGSSSSVHCQCKTHRVSRVDLEYVDRLQRQHAELLEEIELTRNLLQASSDELYALQNSEDLDSEMERLRGQLRNCQRLHSNLQDEKDNLLNRLRTSLASGDQNSRLIQLISTYLRFLTNEKVDRVFLQEGGRDFEMVGRNGKIVSYRNANFETRNKSRMAISLGCAQLLSESGYSIPLVWEDPFVGMEGDDIDLVIRILEKFSKVHGQVLLLSNNRLIQNVFEQRNIPCMDVPDRYSGDESPGVPFETARPRSISVSTNWADINKHFDLAAMDQHGTELYWFENENGRLSVSPHHAESSEVNVKQRRQPKRQSRKANVEPSVRKSSVTMEKRPPFEDSTLRFYLELSSDVEAAPTIGPKTAERLGDIGIYSVSDLVNHQPDWIATKLDHRRIKSRDVFEWQKQALLVCQVPNLRGHDAQLLVACGIESAGQLAAMDALELFDIIDPFAQSKEGQKLLRGSKDPDLAEVTDWVRWARQHRMIERAA